VLQAAQEFTGFSPQLRDFTQVGVIGYGTLGSEAAKIMRQNGAHNIMICDKDPFKRIEASQAGYVISDSVEDLLKQCNIIIIGADTVPLKPEMLQHIRDGAIIAGVTSPDDTMDLDHLVKEKLLTRGDWLMRRKIREYSTPDGKKIYLAYNGEAPNLAGSEIGVNDPSIVAPEGEHVEVGKSILGADGEPIDGHIQIVRGAVSGAYSKALAEMQKKARKDRIFGNGNGGAHSK
jgi:hypothetical protein